MDADGADSLFHQIGATYLNKKGFKYLGMCFSWRVIFAEYGN